MLVATEMGTSSKAAIECAAAVWTQAGAKASSVYLPDRGLKGGGHFAMAQLDNAAYAKVFIELAAEIESSAKSDSDVGRERAEARRPLRAARAAQ